MMENQDFSCKYCHQPVKETDFFCANCGKKIKEKPLSTGIMTLVGVLLVTVLLPPFGLKWAFRYLRQEDTISKVMGWIIVVLSAISLVVGVKMAVDAVNNVNAVVNREMQWMQNYF